MPSVGFVLLSVLWGWCRAWLYQRLNPLLCRWEELHAVASEPTEQHVLFAGDASDAANGLYSALSSSICSVTTPGNPSPVPPSHLCFELCLPHWVRKDEVVSEMVPIARVSEVRVLEQSHWGAVWSTALWDNLFLVSRLVRCLSR